MAQKILLDADFIPIMVQNEKSAKDFSSLLNGAGVILVTTRCVKSAIEMYDKSTQMLSDSLEHIQCVHQSDRVTREKCILSLVETGNFNGFIVATNNKFLIAKLIKMLDVAVIYERLGKLFILGPYSASSLDKPMLTSKDVEYEIESLMKLSLLDGSKTLLISNLLFSISEHTIHSFFMNVAACEIVRSLYALEAGKFTGYALFEFASADAAKKAMDHKGESLCGRALKIEAATAKHNIWAGTIKVWAGSIKNPFKGVLWVGSSEFENRGGHEGAPGSICKKMKKSF